MSEGSKVVIKEVAGPEQQLPILLTLEESGVLCHLMMQNESFRKAVSTGFGTERDKRMFALYSRLAAINDELMGKTR